MTIKTRLTVLIGLLVILASVTVGAFAIFTSTRIIEQNTEDWMSNEADIGALLVNSFIKNRFDILKELAFTDHVRSMDWERQYETLFPYIEEMGVDDFAIIDMNSNARHLGGNTANLSSREYVQRALRGEQTLSDIISQASAAVDYGHPLINFVVPIKQDNRVIGALSAVTNALDLSNLLKGIKARGNSYAYMANSRGDTVAHAARPEAVLENPVEVAKTDSAYSSIAQATQYMVSHKEGGYTQYVFNGAVRLCAFSPVEGYDMTLILTAVRGSVMSEVTQLRNVIIIIVAVFVVIGFLAAIYIANFIANRLKKVRTTVERLGGGDFSIYHKVLAHDEIGAIANALNQCMDSIKRLITTIKERGAMLSDTGKQLSEDMIKTTESMSRIDSNMENINNRMENQSASVIETNSTMRQIITTINKLSENVRSQSESVAQSSSAIEEMLANIQSVTQTLVKNTESVKVLAKASDAGRSGLQGVAADIQEIARESEGLLEINSVMENIAGQTNLLSMNAAIEAAHAGDAGKGFAVVADEIRKLAESSSEQSKTISSVLKKIKESIDKITESTNTVLNKFEDIDKSVKTVSQQEDNIRVSMEEQSAGSKQILDSIEKLNELTRHVKGGSDEMREGSKQVVTESENLEQVTAEITNAMKEMGRGTHQIGSAVKRVNETANQNEENITVLVQEVQKFKVE